MPGVANTMREPMIARHVAAQMPFLATEHLLMRGVKAGGDRQRLHEVIRVHSLSAVEDGTADKLLARLGADPAFKSLKVAILPEEMDPARYIGRAPRQVDDFLDQVVPPVLRRIDAVAPTAITAEVNV